MKNYIKDKYDLPIEIDSVLWEVVRMCESTTENKVKLFKADDVRCGRLVFYYQERENVVIPLFEAIKARLGDRMVDSFNNEYLRAGIVTFKFADVDFPQEFGDMNKKWKDDEDEGNTYAHRLQEVKAIKVERYNVEKLINFVGGGQMTIPRTPNGIAVFSFLNNGGAYLDASEHDYVVRVGESRFKVVPANEFENEWELK